MERTYLPKNSLLHWAPHVDVTGKHAQSSILLHWLTDIRPTTLQSPYYPWSFPTALYNATLRKQWPNTRNTQYSTTLWSQTRQSTYNCQSNSASLLKPVGHSLSTKWWRSFSVGVFSASTLGQTTQVWYKTLGHLLCVLWLLPQTEHLSQ